MALLLHIDTATEVCSVCLAEDGKLLSVKETTKANSHSSLITLFIQDVLKEAGKELKDLDGVAISKGPGSYTGLRIGVSAAKGICFAMDIPLLSVSTLEAMADGAKKLVNEDAYLCPMIDARRMEVYTALYDTQMKEVLAPHPLIVDEHSLSEYTHQKKVYLFGNGAKKCAEVITHPNILLLETFNHSSVNMLGIIYERFKHGNFEDLAYFEPFYLKDFNTNVAN